MGIVIHDETVVFRQLVPASLLGDIMEAEAINDGDEFAAEMVDDGVVYVRQAGASTRTEVRDEFGQSLDPNKRYDIVRITVESLTGEPRSIETIDAFIAVMRDLQRGANNLRDLDREISVTSIP